MHCEGRRRSTRCSRWAVVATRGAVAGPSVITASSTPRVSAKNGIATTATIAAATASIAWRCCGVDAAAGGVADAARPQAPARPIPLLSVRLGAGRPVARSRQILQVRAKPLRRGAGGSSPIPPRCPTPRRSRGPKVARSSAGRHSPVDGPEGGAPRRPPAFESSTSLRRRPVQEPRHLSGPVPSRRRGGGGAGCCKG